MLKADMPLSDDAWKKDATAGATAVFNGIEFAIQRQMRRDDNPQRVRAIMNGAASALGEMLRQLSFDEAVLRVLEHEACEIMRASLYNGVVDGHLPADEPFESVFERVPGRRPVEGHIGRDRQRHRVPDSAAATRAASR